MAGIKHEYNCKIITFAWLEKIYLFFLVNQVLAGTKHFKAKRKLLNSIGYHIGYNTKIIGPIVCTGALTIGDNCWIGKNFTVNGNGSVTIGNNCDIAPDETFQTGGHEIGAPDRRAGDGRKYSQSVGDGTWIGAQATIFNDTHIGDSCVIAGCACVVKNVKNNSLVGGVPAKLIRDLNND